MEIQRLLESLRNGTECIIGCDLFDVSLRQTLIIRFVRTIRPI